MRCWQLLPVSQTMSPYCCCTEGRSLVPGHPTPPQKVGCESNHGWDSWWGGWDTALALANCSSQKRKRKKKHHMSTLAFRPRAAFLGKVGQCKLPLPVRLVSEGERWSSCEEGKGCCSVGTISTYYSHTHTHTHINRHTAVEAGREWVGERKRVSEEYTNTVGFRNVKHMLYGINSSHFW